MAQHDYVIANGTGAAVRSDINNGLAAIVSNNSGATAPSTTYAYQWWADTTTGLLKLRNAANNAWITLFQLDGEWSTLAIENGSAAAPSIYFKDSGTDTGIYSPGTDQVAISTGGTVRLSLSTTAVSSALAIDHPLGAVGTPSITFTGDLNTGIYSPAADTLAFVEGGVEAMRIDSSGRVGIGTTTASTALHVVGGGYFTSNTFLIQEGGVFFTGINSFGAGIYSRASDLVINAGSSERARIDSSGNLLVGVSTGSSSRILKDSSGGIALQVSNTSTTTTSSAMELNVNYTGGTSGWFVRGGDSSAYRFYIYSNGNMANSNNSYGAISDVKLKENIVDAGSQWSDLKAFQVRKYNFKEGQTQTQIGLIAQEVELVSPGLVTESPDRDEDGNDLGTVTKSVNYSVLYMKAVKALQEAMERIEALEADVAALKGA